MQTLGVMVPDSLDSGDLLQINHTSIQHKREWELTLFNLIASSKVNELEGRFINKASPKVNEDYTLLTTSPSKFPNPNILIPWQSRNKNIEQKR